MPNVATDSSFIDKKLLEIPKIKTKAITKVGIMISEIFKEQCKEIVLGTKT